MSAILSKAGEIKESEKLKFPMQSLIAKEEKVQSIKSHDTKNAFFVLKFF